MSPHARKQYLETRIAKFEKMYRDGADSNGTGVVFHNAASDTGDVEFPTFGIARGTMGRMLQDAIREARQELRGIELCL
jgi:hypothetical protein